MLILTGSTATIGVLVYMTSHANINKGIERSVSCLVQLAQVSQGSPMSASSLINRLQLNDELLETNLSTTHSAWHDTILF